MGDLASRSPCSGDRIGIGGIGRSSALLAISRGPETSLTGSGLVVWPAMNPQAMLEELENAAEQISVKVSYEQLAATVGHGGLCRVKEQYRVIIDKRASVHERVATLARSLARLDVSGVFLSPEVRKLVDRYSVSHPAGKPRETPSRPSVLS